MKMTGEQRIAAPREKVWEALNDPEVLRQCIPGCQSLEKEGADKLKATAEIKIGPIGARFTGLVTLSDLDPPNGYTITGEGNGGIAGSAKGGAKVKLSDAGGGATLLAYDVDAQVGGRLAQLGGPIIDATAKQLAGKFFEKFGTIVGGEKPAAAVGTMVSASSASASSSTSAAAPTTTAAGAAPAYAPPSISTGHASPIAWILAAVVAALVGFLVGRGQAEAAVSDWVGLSIGLLVLIVGAAGFGWGKQAAAPVVLLDTALLARLLGEARR